MRIGLNLLGLTPRLSGGIDLYAQKLVQALGDGQSAGAEFVLFCNADNAPAFQRLMRNRPGWTVLGSRVTARPQVARVLAEQFALPILARRSGVDLLHSLSYTWPIASSCRGVVTVCDMLYAVWPEGVPLAKRLFWRAAIPLSVRRCEHTITISESARRDIVRLLKIDTGKVSITYLAGCVTPPHGGVAESAIEAAAGKYARRSRRFLLSVGALGLHKNPGPMVAAFARLRARAEFQDLHLVLAGIDYGMRRKILDDIVRRGLQHAVSLAGYVPVEELRALYAGASVYLSTSLMEGFGMTAVEAMGFGTPVVVSNRGALPEIVADGGVVVDPLQPDDIADAAAGILSNPHRAEELSAAARRRAGEFSWSRTAAETRAVYEKVLQGAVDPEWRAGTWIRDSQSPQS